MTKERKSSISLLLLSKMFERLAFYLIMAILIQYLTESFKLATDTAEIYYSIFYGMIGLTTLFSGLLGDLRDRAKIVKIGFFLLTAMYLVIPFLPSISILILTALILLSIGIGLTSPNIIVLLGNIYNEKENEIFGLSGFILFSLAVNMSGLIAPGLSFYLKNSLGYNAIFLFAFLFGLISLILFLKFKSIYTKLDFLSSPEVNPVSISQKKINTLILISILTIGVLIRFALNQKGLTFTFFVRDYTEKGFDLSQLFSNIEKYISLIFLVLFSVIITRRKHIKWGNIFNIILIGIVLCSIAFITIASFDTLSYSISGNIIIINAFIFILIAETLLSPTIVYIIYRSSPIRYKGLFQGVSYIIMAISNSLLFLGAILYKPSDTALPFIIFTSILVISAILIIILKKVINNKLIGLERNSGITAANKSNRCTTK